MMATEFHGISLACSPDSIIPRGLTFTNATYQTCKFEAVALFLF